MNARYRSSLRRRCSSLGRGPHTSLTLRIPGRAPSEHRTLRRPENTVQLEEHVIGRARKCRSAAGACRWSARRREQLRGRPGGRRTKRFSDNLVFPAAGELSHSAAFQCTIRPSRSIARYMSDVCSARPRMDCVAMRRDGSQHHARSRQSRCRQIPRTACRCSTRVTARRTRAWHSRACGSGMSGETAGVPRRRRPPSR